jgi:hypothetical protein
MAQDSAVVDLGRPGLGSTGTPNPSRRKDSSPWGKKGALEARGIRAVRVGKKGKKQFDFITNGIRVISGKLALQESVKSQVIEDFGMN